MKTSFGFDEIDQMMRDAALLRDGNLCGADVEVPIDLRRIANEDFAAESLRETDSERRLARSGRPEDHNEPREIVHPGNFQYRSRRISKTIAASRRAPTTWARLSLNGG